LLPAFWVVFRQIYREASLLLSMGIAAWLVPWLETLAARLQRVLLWSLAALAGLVPLVAAAVFAGDCMKEWRESRRPFPAAGSPCVLLIVLDTVRADHLSLHGYYRPTSPTLELLAQQGVRFDEARATAPWTLPSHASMFTGRLPHELGVKWVMPLASSFPTLAEYLGAAGYATAGFAANELYCSYETGLARGFTHYEDYLLDGARPLRTAAVVDRVLGDVFNLAATLHEKLIPSSPPPGQPSWFRRLAEYRRRDAHSINQGLLDWLSRRRQPERPFFVFLNYYDAHSPYLPPPGTERRFGLMPRTEQDLLFLTDYWSKLDKVALQPHFQTLARDCYDNCIAYLDEQIGLLMDALKQRGLFEQTLVIVTSDHGEGLGEHELYDHGESLYRTEIHVPLLMLLPGRAHAGTLVRETASLRDLAATIVEQAGLARAAPFPGRSLARFWSDSSQPAGPDGDSVAVSELDAPNPASTNDGRSPAKRGPLAAIAEDEFVYIRNTRDGTEELFNERDDPYELQNRARLAASQPLIARYRARLALWQREPKAAR
jgi:arylsulfatase A-like enzyme